VYSVPHVGVPHTHAEQLTAVPVAPVPPAVTSVDPLGQVGAAAVPV
jgi:hypothetical protein